jgi:hypothetical protein
MSFFDSKEEVINVEFTQYGRYLLSKGKFNPRFYAFYDDDVIYDSLFMGIEEKQNASQTRILEETPFSKPNYSFVSVESSVLEQSEVMLARENLNNLKKIELEGKSSTEVNSSLLFPLGKSSTLSDYRPSWNVGILSGSINNVEKFLDNTNSNNMYVQPYLQIPQINMVTASYIINVTNDNAKITANKEVLDEFSFNQSNPSEITYLLGDKTKLKNILDFIEKNVEDQNENFDLEMFIEEEIEMSNGTKKKVWKKLCFLPEVNKVRKIQDGKLLLLDQADSEALLRQRDQAALTENNVEFYLNVEADDGIELPQDLKTGVYSTIYNTNITEADKPFGENC